LWGTSAGGPKITGFDPYNYLYNYVCKCLEGGYTSLVVDEMPRLEELLEAIGGLLDRCPASNVASVLVHLQRGIAKWVQDEGLKIPSGTPLLQTVRFPDDCLLATLIFLGGLILDENLFINTRVGSRPIKSSNDFRTPVMFVLRKQTSVDCQCCDRDVEFVVWCL